MLNPAKWCREHDVRPDKSWRAVIRVHWKDGRDPWMVRLTAIGESAILVRRTGAEEICISRAFVERLECIDPDTLRTIETTAEVIV